MPTAAPIRAEATATAAALDAVSKLYGSFAALRNVSVTFPSGSSTVILGENGAGKSTLLRVIAGLISNPDVSSATHLVELLADFRPWPVPGGGARTLILTTHQAGLAQPLADRTLTMRQGQIIEAQITDITGTNG